MKTPASLLPDRRTLTTGLSVALNPEGAPEHPVQVLKRRSPRMMCTFPNELVTCRLPSAALAAGEIDLAALTEGTGWPSSLVQRCECAYQRARWPEGAPAGFHRTLDAAKIYLHFRWLGERPDWAVRDKTLWRYDHLRAAATRLGLMADAGSRARLTRRPIESSGNSGLGSGR